MRAGLQKANPFDATNLLRDGFHPDQLRRIRFTNLKSPPFERGLQSWWNFGIVDAELQTGLVDKSVSILLGNPQLHALES
jgi:hypothetical protein